MTSSPLTVPTPDDAARDGLSATLGDEQGPAGIQGRPERENGVQPRTLVIDVAGHPAPKGSKKCVGGRGKVKHQLVEMSPLLPSWTDAVVKAATARRNLTGWATLTEPAHVEIWAYFPRPKSVTREYPSTRGVGDSDKIARSCLDALTAAGVFADDSLVVDLAVHERYAHELVGARIVVVAL